ncbi:MAG: hypothetical protein ACK4TF_04875 [Thermodesulfovibrionales bacterium]
MQEIALCQNEITRIAHKELFNLPDNSYIVDTDIIKEILKISTLEALRVHLCLNWSGLFNVILWSDDLSSYLIKNILIKAGLEEKELKDMTYTEPLTFFYWLYYGKRFKILRKLCHMARDMAQDKVRVVRFECHLIAEEIPKIVASTL